MFEPVRHDDHFDIQPDPRQWIAQHHPDAEATSMGTSVLWQWDGGSLQVSMGMDKVLLTIGDKRTRIEVGFTTSYSFDHNGDLVHVPHQREVAQVVEFSPDQKVITQRYSDGTITTDTVATSDQLLQRTILNDDGVATFGPRLQAHNWEVSDTAVTHGGERIAICDDGVWVWLTDTRAWLASRTELRMAFKGQEFNSEGIPVVPR